MDKRESELAEPKERSEKKAEEKKLRGIYERVPGSGEWWIRYADKAGKIHREKAGNRSAAKDLYRKRKQGVLEGKKLPEKLRQRDILFGELIDDALEYSKGHKRSFSDDVCRMKRVRQWFGGVVADDIKPASIERRLSSIAHAEDLAPATVNRYRSLMSLCFRLGMENEKCQGNPARVMRARKESNERVRFLGLEEEEGLRKVIREHWPDREPELDIALNTGLRRGGMYRLNWRDVDFENAVLTERYGKSGKRHVPLNTAALDAFLKLRKASDGKGRVFDIKKPRYWFEKAVTLAGIEDFHWHDLRHTFASRLTMLGVPLRQVQTLMGHGSITVTARYSHLAPSFGVDAVEKLTGFSSAKNGTDTKTGTEEDNEVSGESVYVN